MPACPYGKDMLKARQNKEIEQLLKCGCILNFVLGQLHYDNTNYIIKK